jgi:DHA1 family tetracycline resistance protein-like MFS transporter
MKRPSPLLAIFMVVLVDVLGLTVMIPLLPFYAEKYGASPTVVGALLTTYSLCQLVAGPLLGKWSDRVGRRPLLLISQLGTLASLILLAQSKVLWLIFAARAIDGLTAGNLSLAQAYIADVTAPENRAKSFALIGVAFGVGFTIGPAVSGWLSTYGLTWPIYLAAALSASSVALTYFLLPEAPRTRREGARVEKIGLIQWNSYVKYFRPPALRARLVQMFLFYLAFATFQSGFALFAERRFSWKGHPFGPHEVGWVFALAGVVGVLEQGFLIGKLVRWLGESMLVRLGFFAAAASYAVLAGTTGIPLLVIAVAVGALGGGAIRPILTSLITQGAGAGEYGSILGLNQSLMAVAQIVTPTIAGFLIGERLLATWSLLAAGLYFIAFVLPVPKTEAAAEQAVA